jgi:hypothetical protein
LQMRRHRYAICAMVYLPRPIEPAAPVHGPVGDLGHLHAAPAWREPAPVPQGHHPSGLLSPRTVRHAIQRLADLGLITIQSGSVYEITPPGDLGG